MENTTCTGSVFPKHVTADVSAIDPISRESFGSYGKPSKRSMPPRMRASQLVRASVTACATELLNEGNLCMAST